MGLVGSHRDFRSHRKFQEVGAENCGCCERWQQPAGATGRQAGQEKNLSQGRWELGALVFLPNPDSYVWAPLWPVPVAEKPQASDFSSEFVPKCWVPNVV